METKTATPSTSSARKRKVEIATQLLKSPPPPPYAQLDKRPRRRVVSVSKIVLENAAVRDADDAVCASPRSSSGSDHVEEASCCSSNGSSELVEDGNMKFVDLEDDDDDDESDEVESRTYNPLTESRREMTPSSDLQPQSTAAESRRGSSTAEKMPTELELEEFFTAAEKDIQNKFSHKYNYDIVKDAPLEGPYEWVRLKP